MGSVYLFIYRVETKYSKYGYNAEITLATSLCPSPHHPLTLTRGLSLSSIW